MKRFYFSKLVILFFLTLIGCGFSSIAQPYGSFSYSYSGAPVFYTVPLGVYSLTIDMVGARGGFTCAYGTTTSFGNGGRVKGTMAVTPGMVLQMTVGGQGAQGCSCCGGSVANAGGYNGGGKGCNYGGGGGGATDIRVSPYSYSERVVVAGGGGGWGAQGCNSEYGGNGGGLTGGVGYMCGTTSGYFCYVGQGGSQTAGGQGATCGPGQNGGFGPGGNAYASGYYAGAGGGGGYWGGGGGYYYGAGGGGSSYANPTYISGVNHTQGYYDAAIGNNGKISITANCTSPVKGAIVGASAHCGSGNTVLYTNPTGSAGGVWSTDNTLVATIDPGTGILTTTGIGTATISYNLDYGGCGITTATMVTTVNSIPSPIAGTPIVCQNGTVQVFDGGGGTWSSGNVGLATVTPGPGISGGVITGVNAGNPVITYTLPTGCQTTITATVNPNPSAITGPTQMCNGGSVTLSDATSGGVWSTNSTITAIDPGGNITTVNTSQSVAEVSTVMYQLSSTGCFTTRNFTTNANPTPYTIYDYFGSGIHYCSNDPAGGTDVQLQLSEPGVNYQVYKNMIPYGTPTAGTGGAIDFGNLAAGSYTAVGVNGTTGCVNNMLGTADVFVDPAPFRANLTLGGNLNVTQCSNITTLPDVTLDNSETGVQYLLYQNNTLIDAQMGSTGNPITFNPYTPAAYNVFYVIAQNVLLPTACTDTMLNMPSLTIMPVPNVDTVAGTASFCPGGGAHVKLKYSNPGINYQLYRNGSSVGGILPGSSSGIDFGVYSTPGSYTVIGTNAMTGCFSNMYDSAVLSYNPVPNIDTLSGGGAYCAGGTGIDLQMNNTESGTTYQLWIGGTTLATTMVGSGAMSSFGPQFTQGVYTVVAKNIYGCTSNQNGSSVITVNPLPKQYVMNGGGSFCMNGAGVSVGVDSSELGITYQLLYNTTPSGGALSGSGLNLDFGLQTNQGNYTVLATNPSTSCTSMMLGTSIVSINVLPVQYPVTGGGNYCIGTAGSFVNLGYGALGVDYQLYNNGSAVGPVMHGGNSALSFGQQTGLGLYTVMGTNTTTGCSDTMANGVTVTSSPSPSVYMVTASGSSYCSGGAGVDVMLSSSEAGVNYQFYHTGLPQGAALPGTGLSLDFGNQTLPGSYTVVATNGTTGCASNMFGSAVVTINALPTIYTVTGGGDYCAGSGGVNVGLTKSDTWINYQLYVNGMPSGSAVPGNGSALSFGMQTATGTYQVIATNPLTTCSSMMNGSTVVNSKPAPNVYSVTGGGSYCMGGTGMTVGLSNSDAGVSYQLYNGMTTMGSALTGNNLPLSFGLQSAAGGYTVVATTVSSGCKATMSGSANISINSLPSQFTVYGGGSYCTGTPAPHVMLSGSVIGTNYQLYKSGTPVGTFVTATGAALDFGAQAATGAYTIIGTDALTGCSNSMVSTVNITENLAPDKYTVTGGGHYCAGKPGVNVGLSWSVAGISYQLMKGGSPVGMALGGGGLALDFGIKTDAGTYSVVATNPSTGCSQTMDGSAVIAIDPTFVPTSKIITSSGIADTVCAGNTDSFYVMTTGAGTMPSYTWKVNGVIKGFGASYSYIPANGDVLSVMVNSSEACASPGSSSDMMMITVKPYQMPSVTLTADPGSSVCAGTTATYNATVVNGGYTPDMNWIKNSVIVATNTTTYSYIPNDKDVIIFMLGSSYPCRLKDTVFSNTFKMAVDASIPPTVTIFARRGTTIMAGQLDTFEAIVSNAGTDPKFQWFKNSTPIPGANSAKYISREFFDHDSLTVQVTSSGACGMSSFNSTIISLNNLGTRQVSISNGDVRVIPNPNKGAFDIKGSLGVQTDEEVSLEITNMLGQTVYRNTVTARDGNISEHVKLDNNIASGMYLLNLRSGATQNIYHIVIEQ